MNLDDVFPHCDCFEQYRSTQPLKTRFHGDVQDKSCDGWKRLIDLVEVAAADGREDFSPGRREMPIEEWRQVITLPASIARLKAVRRLVLYGSWLVRIPPEIGEIEQLERFEPYTSHRLHWFPYEITRCHKLMESVVSTRSLYGNYKHRPPFASLQPTRPSSADLDLDHLDPAVWGVDAVTACSVCGRSLKTAALHQAWISMSVATDVLPLLVNACSANCVRQIPLGAAGYLRTPHRGGPTVLQPPPEQ